MKFALTVFVIFSLVFLAVGEKAPRHDEIVEENAICLDEIKALELCLKEAGQGKGWCEIGASVTEKVATIPPNLPFKFLADPSEAISVCMKQMAKMNECIKGKGKA